MAIEIVSKEMGSEKAKVELSHKRSDQNFIRLP